MKNKSVPLYPSSKLVWRHPSSGERKPKPRREKRNRAVGLMLPDFRAHHKATSVKTVCYWRTDRHTGRWDRTKEPERNPDTHDQLTFVRGAKPTRWGRTELQRAVLEHERPRAGGGWPCVSLHMQTLTQTAPTPQCVQQPKHRKQTRRWALRILDLAVSSWIWCQKYDRKKEKLDKLVSPQLSALHLVSLPSFACSVKSLSRARLFATPGTAARQASPSITNSQSSLKLISIALVMPSNHLILCRPLLLSPSIFPSIRVFSSESALHIRWPKHWSFSFSPSNEYSGLISFRMVWFDLWAVQGTLKSLLQHHSSCL